MDSLEYEALKPGTQCIINKTWRMLSAGTRVTVVNDPNRPWKKKGDAVSSGYVRVQMTSRPGHRLIDNGVPYMGIFDIEWDYLTPIRERVDIVNV